MDTLANASRRSQTHLVQARTSRSFVDVGPLVCLLQPIETYAQLMSLTSVYRQSRTLSRVALTDRIALLLNSRTVSALVTSLGMRDEDVCH